MTNNQYLFVAKLAILIQDKSINKHSIFLVEGLFTCLGMIFHHNFCFNTVRTGVLCVQSHYNVVMGCSIHDCAFVCMSHDRILYYLVFLSGYPHVKNSCSSVVRALLMFIKVCGLKSHQGNSFHRGSHFWLIIICIQMTSPHSF
jgi:hypothetical protein